MPRRRRSIRIRNTRIEPRKKPQNHKPTPKPQSQNKEKSVSAKTQGCHGMTTGTRGLLRLPDKAPEYPLLSFRVYIHDEDEDERNRFTEMFVRARCRKALNIYDADLVVFTGGPDVNPALYGQNPHLKTRFDLERDERDKLVFEECASLGIPMFGVCRGMQFIHVMMGGKLHQDLDNHQSRHSMVDDLDKSIVNVVSSVHHQCVAPREDKKMLVVAHVSKSLNKYTDAYSKLLKPTKDIEAIFYPGVCAFGVQGHPEYAGFQEFTVWCLKKLEDFIIMNPDVEWTQPKESTVPVRRLKDDIRAQARLDWTDYPLYLNDSDEVGFEITPRKKLTIDVKNAKD